MGNGKTGNGEVTVTIEQTLSEWHCYLTPTLKPTLLTLTLTQTLTLTMKLTLTLLSQRQTFGMAAQHPNSESEWRRFVTCDLSPKIQKKSKPKPNLNFQHNPDPTITRF